ncbi:LOW QUALITY PROTEIN: hypothetical protein NC651_009483 [Populus alba x Populus x berolinensis]|nr:LOW QUALITY PROTEIN: hypothetical protein NC651_009483 [Populus alba x Populus x berolinensis]
MDLYTEPKASTPQQRQYINRDKVESSREAKDLEFLFPRQNNFLEKQTGRLSLFSDLLKMFKNTFQSGFLSILYSLGSKPLQIWDKEGASWGGIYTFYFLRGTKMHPGDVKRIRVLFRLCTNYKYERIEFAGSNFFFESLTVSNGHIKRLHDEDIQSNVLEIVGSNIQSTYITCPADPGATLGIKLPFLVMIVKNVKKYFTFEIQVLDDKNVRRRFRASNFQTVTRVKPYICTMPLKLDEGWNQIQLNLADFTRRAYGTNYVETLRVQVHANCRLRRIYFSDRLYSEEELPPEFKLYLPVRIPCTAPLVLASSWLLYLESMRRSWLRNYCCSMRIS